MENRYIYFISYSHNSGFGNCEVHCNKKIAAWSEINELSKQMVSERGVAKNPIILYFKLLSGPTNNEKQDWDL